MSFASIICNLTLSGAKFRERRSYRIVYEVSFSMLSVDPKGTSALLWWGNWQGQPLLPALLSVINCAARGSGVTEPQRPETGALLLGLEIKPSYLP